MKPLPLLLPAPVCVDPSSDVRHPLPVPGRGQQATLVASFELPGDYVARMIACSVALAVLAAAGVRV